MNNTLGNAAYYSEKTISTSELDLSTYVTTDSLLANKQGKTNSINLPPKSENCTKFEKGDILIANIRPYLKKIWLADIDGGCSADVLVFKSKEGYLPNFLYYALLSDDFFIHSMKGSKGTKMPRGDKDHLLEFLIPDFEYAQQEKISQVLSVLDKKIILNNKTNIELEAMAKLIYDYWFVQFDFPDENDKPYKSSGGKMVYDENLKKEVPCVWSVRNISEMMKICSGYPFKSASYLNSGTYKIVTIKNVQDNKLILDNTDLVNSIPSDIESSSILKLQDILISLTGNVGRICLVDEQNLLLNQRVGKFQTSPILKNYFYLTYQTLEFRSWLERISTGTSQKNLSPIEAVNRLHAFPDSSILIEFDQLVGPMIKKILSNLMENKKLESLRNWLLPMLMNDQITVS